MKMSFPGSPNRTLPNDDYLRQKFGRVSLSNEAQDDLYVRSDGSHSMPSTTNETYEPQMDPVRSNWDYTTPQTRNSDAVVGELTPEEVRWFYKCDGEKRWLEFSGYDSLHIEMQYREILERSKFSAFSDQTTKPSGSNFNFPGSSSYFGASSIRFPSKPSGNDHIQQTIKVGDSQHLPNKIIVRGGLYDINFETWKCSSIYWPGEECLIMRGTWFFEGTWQPLEQEHSQILESKHLMLFQGHKQSEFAENEIKGNVMHTENFPDFIVEWISPTQVYLYSENTPSKVVRTVSTRLGFRKSSGYRLFRGYKCEASMSDRPDVEITHLVFVIHGIGQKMDTGRIIRNTSSFRDCVSWLKQKYFSNFPNHRAEFFPVEWRSNLQLDGDLVDAITPNTLHSLRQMLNASAMDIMYYTSPLYGGEVQRGLREELNRLYSMFSARNPYFMSKRGKISIIAHSLGCVILYDIIMGLKPGSLVQNNQQGLLFQVQNFFCLGSPLSVFLALRWKDSQIPGKMGVVLPQRLCHRLYNVFHPTDPVAYRIEPLLVKGYAKIAPLVVQPYNAGFRTPYSEMPMELIVPEQQTTTAEAAATVHDTGSSGQLSNNKEEYSPGGTPKDKSWSLWGLKNRGSTRSQDSSSLEPLQEGLEYRLDYILRESNLGVSYLSALTSHTAYWTNYDVAYFILTQIFPEFEKNDPSLYTSDKSYSDKFNSYSQGYHSQTLPCNYENRNYNQYDGNRTSYREQDVVRHPVAHPSHSHEPGVYGQPPSPRLQPPGYVERQDFNQPYSHLPPTPAQQNSQNVPTHPQPPDHQNYSQSHQMECYQPPPQPQPQPSVQGYQKPQESYGCYHQPSQSYQPTPSSSVSGYQHQPSSHHSYQQPQPIHQHQQQPKQPQGYQLLQQRPSGYQQVQQHPPGYQQQQNYQQEQPSQSYQQSSQNFQGSLSTAGPSKHVQMKTGFFEKMTEEKKPQGAGSPTKSTKSFFPTFNLSSLTSPVKNLSNSLSNISNQMTNIASSKDSIGSNGSNVQNRSPSSGLLGNVAPSRNMSPSYNQPNRTQSPQVQFTQGHFGQTHYQQQSTGPNQFPTQQSIRSSSPYEGAQVGSMSIRSGSPVSLQNRCSPMLYGPIETPVGAIKPKTIRLQPKVPNYEPKVVQYGHDPFVSNNKSRSVSPLGQSRVVCSGSRSALPTTSCGLPLGARSLSSGNLRNSTLVSGTYPGSRSNFSYLNQASYLAHSGLDRRTMSRPNLSTTGSSYGSSGLGFSTLTYNSSFGGARSYLNREYSGPSSRGIRRQREKQTASKQLFEKKSFDDFNN